MSKPLSLASLLLVSTALVSPAAFAQTADPTGSTQSATPAADPATAAQPAPQEEPIEVSIPGGGDPGPDIVVTSTRARNIIRTTPQVVSVLSSADIARYLDQDLTRARAGYKRAIALNPSSEGARIGFAKMLAALGEFPAAIREADQAANELDPLCLTANVTSAWVRYLAGDYETAIARCRDTLEMDESYAFARRLLGSALLASGKVGAAVRMFERAVEAEPANALSLACLAHARAVSGNRGTALDLLARLQDLGRDRYVSPYYVATIHAGLGDGDAARAALKRAGEDRDPMLAYLYVDPRMAGLTEAARAVEVTSALGR